MNKKISAAILLWLSLSSGSAYAQPSQGGGSAQAGVGVSGPGRLVRVDQMHERDMREINKLNPGEESERERARIEQLALGKNPRQEIVKRVNSLAKGKNGPPVLQSGQLTYVDDDSIAKLFPAQLFYVLRFRQWPVAMPVPEPLSYNNLFILTKGKNLDLITDSAKLKAYFQENVKEERQEEKQKEVAKTWLRLAEELCQDGMFKFEEPTVVSSMQGPARVWTGRAPVAPTGGNTGEISVRMVFDAGGNIIALVDQVALKAGMRPICQSTKLLDKDPIVRKMAEQDLLIMGKAAGPYLKEQRAKVDAPLRDAIDKIWQRILDENRYGD